jgi:hypothetical protein
VRGRATPLLPAVLVYALFDSSVSAQDSRDISWAPYDVLQKNTPTGTLGVFHRSVSIVWHLFDFKDADILVSHLANASISPNWSQHEPVVDVERKGITQEEETCEEHGRV